MDFTMIVDAVAHQGIWCALFVWLFYTSREESKGRENKLMGIIESYNEKLSKITDTLDAINDKIDRFHGKDL
jgi:hypothetical protein